MAGIWDALVDCICRPPRDEYDPTTLLGGPTGMLNEDTCRIDFEVVNKKGLKLQCSQYIPLDVQTVDGRLPVVIYCHCNSGSKRDADEAVVHLLPVGISVVAFDFSGSGLSGGQWVTLGANEVEDLEAVVHYLREKNSVSSIGLWGRSMGAVTALMYSARDPSIAGMVLDSPFSRLTDLMLEIVQQQKLPIPKIALKMVLRMMRSSVRKKAGFDINGVAPIDLVPNSVVPAVFGHGLQDSFINISHSEKLQQAYGGEYRNLVRFEGDHNHPRPRFFYDSVAIFFHQQLQLEKVLVQKRPFDQALLHQAGASLAEDEARSQGVTNQPWQVEDLPDPAAQPNLAADLAAAATQEGGSQQPGAAGSSKEGSPVKRSQRAALQEQPYGGGWQVDASEQLRRVPVVGARRVSSGGGAALSPRQQQLQQQAALDAAALEEQQLAAAIAASLEQARIDEEARLQRQQQEQQQGVQGSAGPNAPAAAAGVAGGLSSAVAGSALGQQQVLQAALAKSLLDCSAVPPAQQASSSLASSSQPSLSESSSPKQRRSLGAGAAGVIGGQPAVLQVPLRSEAARAPALSVQSPSEAVGAELAGSVAPAFAAGGRSPRCPGSPSSTGSSTGVVGMSLQPLRKASAGGVVVGSPGQLPPVGSPSVVPMPAAVASPVASPSRPTTVTVLRNAASEGLPGVNMVSLRRSVGGMPSSGGAPAAAGGQHDAAVPAA